MQFLRPAARTEDSRRICGRRDGFRSPRRAFAAAARAILALAALFALSGAGPRTAHSQAGVPDGFLDRLVTGGLDLPVGMAFLPDGRLLVIEQFTAQVRLVVNDAIVSGPIGTIPFVNISGVERGLLGIAVDPAWPAKPYVYIHATITGPEIRISRFMVTGDLSDGSSTNLTLDPLSRHDLVTGIPDDAGNHNGGTVRFGPGGYLYVSLGEDGNACAAQDTTSLRGVILRLDVSRLPAGPGSATRDLVTPPDNPFVATGGLDARLIWAFGLRNPFRFHIDPTDGVLFIGDVGLSHWEEIDRAPSGGLDFGWPVREGPDPGGSCPNPFTLTEPIAWYDRSSLSAAAVIGAGVYRAPVGALRPYPVNYEGDYFYGDYYTGRLVRLKGAGDTWDVAPPVPGQPDVGTWATGLVNVPDYLVGPDGSLWYCVQFDGPSTGGGEIRRIETGTAVSVPGPLMIELSPAFPSPGVNFARLRYSLSSEVPVEIALYDLRGRRVRLLRPSSPAGPGSHIETWEGKDDDGRDVPPGLYFARVVVDGRVLTRRVTLIR